MPAFIQLPPVPKCPSPGRTGFAIGWRVASPTRNKSPSHRPMRLTTCSGITIREPATPPGLAALPAGQSFRGPCYRRLDFVNLAPCARANTVASGRLIAPAENTLLSGSDIQIGGISFCGAQPSIVHIL